MFLLPSSKTPYDIQIDGFERPAVEPAVLPEPVLVRQAASRDDARIKQLARLDDRRLPEGPFLVAELGGDPVAALALPTGTVVADPFRRTADAVDMLRLRAAQVTERERLAAQREVHPAFSPAPA
jgi:hypothetical protein